MTLTGKWTGEVAEVFVVLLRTLAPAVTDVCHVQTDSGATTAVETRAEGTLAVILVLVTWAVIDSITADIQGQTQALA